MSKWLDFMIHPTKLVLSLSSHGLLPIVSDKRFLKIKYKQRMGRTLNIVNPKTFNEKMQWLKLYDRNPMYTEMVDKYKAKVYAAERIGEEYIIPTIGVWNHFEEIDFGALPDQFVLKCTHDSGGLVICKDKSSLDKEQAETMINHCLKMNYYLISREWPYKNVLPRILAEQYMSDGQSEDLMDYKIHNFNGVPKMILVCGNRFSNLTEDFYTPDWEHMEVSRRNHPNADMLMERPKELKEMLRLAAVLSKDIPFLRTDFYVIKGKIYFGELTFFPASGMEPFLPEKYDRILGDWIKLP